MEQVLSGAFPFDEVTMDEDHGYEGPPEGVREHEEHERDAAGAAAPRKEER